MICVPLPECGVRQVGGGWRYQGKWGEMELQRLIRDQKVGNTEYHEYPGPVAMGSWEGGWHN